MINFSILIPHKNTPDLLQRCLDSIHKASLMFIGELYKTISILNNHELTI
jgi:hypothetical protein